MVAEFCSHCQAMKEKRVTVFPRKVSSSEGYTEEIEARRYHNQSCCGFIRSEDVNLSDDGSWVSLCSYVTGTYHRAVPFRY